MTLSDIDRPVSALTVGTDQARAVDLLAGHLEPIVERAIRATFATLADRMDVVLADGGDGGSWSIDDLAVIPAAWDRSAALEIEPVVEQAYGDAFGRVAGLDTVAPYRASEFMASARQRLRGVGRTLLTDARAELLPAFAARAPLAEVGTRLARVLGSAVNRALTIARTEMVGAANAGALAAAHVAGYTHKTWLSCDDSRVRGTHSHAGAHGQRRPLNQSFTVGGFQLRFPGDPLGPPQEIINCRCVVVVHHEGDNLAITAGGDPVTATTSQTLTLDGKAYVLTAAAPAPPEPDPEPVEEQFHAVMVVEGTETGDFPKREYSPGSLTWVDPSTAMVPLNYLQQSDHGGQAVAGAVFAGRFTRIERTGPNTVEGWGVFDSSPPGQELMVRVVEHGMFGISIDPDSITDADVELIFPEPEDDDDGEGDDEDEMFEAMFGPPPEKVLFHAGRLRGATAVAFPALVEAYLEPTDAGRAAVAALVASADEPPYAVPAEMRVGARVRMGADGEDAPTGIVVVFNLPARTVDIEWDDDGRLQTGVAVRDVCIVEEFAQPGQPDAPAATGAETDEPPTRLVVASGDYTVTIPGCPPAAWYRQPDLELLHEGALTVEDNGRVYGLVAPVNVAHIGMNGNTMAPFGNVDYHSKFLKGQTPLADGSRIVTGVLTMGCGHADRSLPSGVAAEHYDNSCSVFATVTIGEIAGLGVWVAGALVSPEHPTYGRQLQADDIRRAMACVLSGDWRPAASGSPYRYEFNGALLVPVPGFPKGRQASTRWAADAEHGDIGLVASAVPVRFLDHHTATLTLDVPVDEYLSLLDTAVGYTKGDQLARLDRIVNGGE